MSIEIDEDTIVALATPPGIGALSVIRLSGSRAFFAVDKIFSGKSKISEAKSHTIHYGNIVSDAGVVDDVIVSVFRKPNSYTGENSVEISTHGNPLISEKIIGLLLRESVRTALPGEFTKRALLNNRLDLSQAEAVADLINARTEASLHGARNQLNGLLSQSVKSIREKIVKIASHLELGLDFSEEGIEIVPLEEVTSEIDKLCLEIDNLLKTYSFGKVLKDGIKVVIVGEPNVGKSSLMNYLVKESRAIVSSIPGTTRDIIREEISIDGFFFRLYDTAGLRLSEDEVEKEGVNRSRQAIKDADLIVFLGDTQVGFSEVLFSEMVELNSKAKILKILNKNDLISSNNYVALDLKISVKTGEGLTSLLSLLKDEILHNQYYTEGNLIISNLRHHNCLLNSRINLSNAKNSAINGLSGEFIAQDLREAVFVLGDIVGEITTDDILSNIFSTFCIGK
jgi:tRNA modification GTPase